MCGQRHRLIALFAGSSRHLHALFVVADLSTVWAEFHVFSKDIGVVKAGQKIRVKNIQGDDGETESTVTQYGNVGYCVKPPTSMLSSVFHESGESLR